MKHSPVLILLMIGLSLYSSAQQTRFINDPRASFNQAKEYFQKEQYSLAYPILKDLQQRARETDRSNDALNYQDLRYYTTVCALKQNEERAIYNAQEFIDLEDNAARVQMMSFHLAEYYYRKQDFSKAIEAFEKVNISNLSNDEIAAMKFHLGYSYFTVQRFEQAKPLLNTIRQMPKDPNYLDANYYYGFIAFYDRDYSNALEAFRVVENHETYGKVVPYYISTIQYSQKDEDKAVAYAESKLKTGNQVYDLEMRQLIGHNYFQKQQYAKAIPYLEEFVNKSKKVTRQELYELSYSYYQTGNLKKAIDGFKQLGGKEDSLAQNAMYLLGDAYLKTNQKANARNAFLFCSANSSNEKQKEISQFNYAKLSYELGYQDAALSEFQKFIQTYPQSEYSAEAKDLLVGVLAKTSNYDDAITLISQMKNPSPTAKQVYPRILYGRASELINDGQLDRAKQLLDQAEKSPNNQAVLPLIQFWKGELAYRSNNIDDAIRYYFDYLRSGTVNGDASPTSVKYNLGYCFLKKENYNQATGFFEEIVKTPKINSPALEQDAYIRTADCYYMNRDYRRAESMYNKVLEYSWPASDYATFQKAMIEGVSNGKRKIDLLSTMSRKFPTSPLRADANMEIASTYLANEQYQEAIPFLKNVVNDPNASLKPRAHLRLGIAYYNLGNNAEALKQYSALLDKFPNSPEAEAGLDNAKTIYVEEGRSGEYVDFAKKIGRDISSSQEDELSYQEAEVQFNNGNFPGAAEKFENYLSKYPNGKYALEAYYYKSEIYLSQKNFAKAAEGYEALADRVPHKFGEKSLLQAARINFFDLKRYENAEKYFAKLKDFASNQESRMEAMRGLLRSQFQLKKYDEAVANAKDLLAEKAAGTDDRILANMAIAKAAQNSNDCETAITNYRTVANLSKAAYGAEARFEIANCFFTQNKLSDAEKAAFEVIKKSGSYEEWVTHAYILLGDIYFKQKDYFNAKATYKSVVDNAKIENLRQEAEAKLKQVTEEEATESKVSE
ncbi:MAG: tetratricopeptide repeat protein [Chitinophagaceae bacterium]|nr:tetratricopeptide repeat protein [Chitinophagaceae bacterium]